MAVTAENRLGLELACNNHAILVQLTNLQLCTEQGVSHEHIAGCSGWRESKEKGQDFCPPRDYSAAEGETVHSQRVWNQGYFLTSVTKLAFAHFSLGQRHIPLQTLIIFRKSGRKAKAFPKIKLRFPQVRSYPGS